jgi:beta-glucosidase
MHEEPYRDSSRSTEERVADLLGRMTLAEKVGQMLVLDASFGVEHLIRDLMTGSILRASPENMTKAFELATRTRLGIPLLTGDDAIHGHSFWPGATIFPTQLAMACTWDAALIEAGARATAVEVAATGIHWTFSPVLCISRDLRWGRVDETFGEDPFLIGEFASAMVRGYQGNGFTDPTSILACAKHFAGYSETQGGRDASEADISQRKLRSWFLPPFERVAREGCATFMLGYQSIDGTPITTNQWLLNDVLRGEWGYAGTLVTDWDNVGRLVWQQHTSEDAAAAAAAAVKAGNDLILATPDFFEGAQEAVRRGQLSVSDIDQAVARILRMKFDMGLFENPRRPDRERQRSVIGTAEHAALNLELARRSLVLLRNNGTLPLLSGTEEAKRAAPSRTVAVIGPNANATDAQLGDWAGASGQADWMMDGQPRELIETVIDGFRAVAPPQWTVLYAEGSRIAEFTPAPEGVLGADGQPAPFVPTPAEYDPELAAEALSAASAADYVVAVVGDTIGLIGEGRSTATLELFGAQTRMLEDLAATGKPFIVVVISSKPLALPAAAQSADAVIQAFNPGMRGGRAIAELILGEIEPTGRLPISFARHVGQQPVYYNQVVGQHGNRYADLTQEPLYAFGEGLSFTTVDYSHLQVHTTRLRPSGTFLCTVIVTNTGSRPVVETVQAYIHDVVTSATWAGQELKAYRQVALRPGQSAKVGISFPAAECSIVDQHGNRVVEPGQFRVLVGPSSRERDLLSGEFTIVGD